MADAEKKKSKAPARGKTRRGRAPTKTEINLAAVGEKHVNGLIAIPAILLIFAVAALFSKFLVYDRMMEVRQAWREVDQLQTQLDEGYEELADYQELADLYAHYTYSGMTREEQERISRVEVLSVLDRVILPEAGIDSLSIESNRMTLNMTGSTLQEINLLVQQLEADRLVDFCTVTTAVSSENDGSKKIFDENTIVSARVVVYLNSASEVEAE